MAGFALGLAVLWIVTAVITVAVGRGNDTRFSFSAGLFFALALASSPAMFLAVGALTSQLAATRRQAAGLAAGVLGAAFEPSSTDPLHLFLPLKDIRRTLG